MNSSFHPISTIEAGPSVSEFPSTHPWRNKLGRVLWGLVWLVLFRCSPRVLFSWRNFLLRCFGARIGRGTHVYPNVRIWAPWNLDAGQTVGIADGACIYNPDRVVLEDFAVISQEAFLCAASHDYTRWTFPLVTGPVRVGRHAWVAARAFIHMGVTIGEGCVIGAASVVTHDTPPWTVCAGNPCKVIRSYDKN